MRVKVQNEIGLERDTHTKAVINTDYISYNKYIEARKRLHEQREEISLYKNELQSLREEMAEVRASMAAIISRLNSKE